MIDKIAAFTDLKNRGREGAVFKNIHALFSVGRPANGGAMLKCKFYATLSAIVDAKTTGKSSFASFVYRNDAGEICIPGEYLRQSIIQAARFKSDPRSPRKSASDLFKAGITSLTELASLGVKDWDYLDRRRVMIQRNGITRVRPAMHKGWRAEFDIQVFTPEYIDSMLLNEMLMQAGRLIGIGDFRPSYGRFMVVNFEVKKEV